MNMFQKLSRWAADKSDIFVRGGVAREEEPVYEAEQMQADGYETSDTMRREMMDPFGDGDRKYGGRQPYRSRADIEAEAMQKAAERQYAQQQEQYAQQQEQYAQQQEQYAMQQQQYAQQQQYVQQPEQYPQQPQYTQPQQPEQQYAQPGNVVTFPGMQTAGDGTVYAHVEYIVQLTSRSQCRTVIDYIRTNASVFLNMEEIDNPSERQRCVDMLSGAAYALGCALNRISPQGVYLISSPSVRVMMDNATQRMAAAPEVRSFARQSYEPQQTTFATQQAMPEEPVESVRSGGFSSGSPTQRFQSQGAQGMPVSFGTAMAGSLTSTHRAVHSPRYNAQ